METVAIQGDTGACERMRVHSVCNSVGVFDGGSTTCQYVCNRILLVASIMCLDGDLPTCRHDVCICMPLDRLTEMLTKPRKNMQFVTLSNKV